MEMELWCGVAMALGRLLWQQKGDGGVGLSGLECLGCLDSVQGRGIGSGRRVERSLLWFVRDVFLGCKLPTFEVWSPEKSFEHFMVQDLTGGCCVAVRRCEIERSSSEKSGSSKPGALTRFGAIDHRIEGLVSLTHDIHLSIIITTTIHP